MKKILVLIIIYGIAFNSFGQNEQEQNFYYVINALGAELYESPSLKSKIIKKINVGKKVLAVKIFKTEESKKVNKGLFLQGDFIKVKHEKTLGFIFSSDLTKFKPEVRDIYEGILIADIFGVEKSKRIKKRIETYSNKEFEVKDEITEYENGSYMYTAFDGCFDHVYIFKNLSFNEVYHQMTINNFQISTTTNGNQLEIPIFLEKIGNEFYFLGEGATVDLKIVDNNDGTFTVSSYDCT